MVHDHLDYGGNAIKYHARDDQPVYFIEHDDGIVVIDGRILHLDECTDDDCARDHVHVLTADQYDAINNYYIDFAIRGGRSAPGSA